MWSRSAPSLAPLAELPGRGAVPVLWQAADEDALGALRSWRPGLLPNHCVAQPNCLKLSFPLTANAGV